MTATSYQFAPGADAIFLFDQGNWYPQHSEGNTARLVRHYQIKILTEEGLAWTNQVIPFQKGERISGLRAQVHYWDEDRNKRKKSLMKVGALPDSTISADSLVKTFVMSEATVGSVLEVRYYLITPRGDIPRPWYFQQKIPVKYSELQLNPFEPLTYRIKTLPSDFVAVARNRWVRRYNDPYPWDDPYLVNPNDHRLQIRFQLNPFEMLTNEQEWKDLSYALEIGTLAEEKLEVLEALGALAYSLTRQAVTEEEKVANIVRHLQKYMTWNRIYAPGVSNSPGLVYKSRTGNSTDINMLLFLLLESAGFDPTRVFVSTRSHGTPVDEPFWAQFNHMIVRCLVDGQFMYLDASQSHLDYLWLPLNSANERGWEISDSTTQWVEVSPSTGSMTSHVLNLQLDDSATITGNVNESYLGYPELPWNCNVDVSGFQLEAINPHNMTLEPRRESPVTMAFQARETTVKQQGDTLLLPLDLYDWAATLPMIAESRALPTNVGYPQEKTVQMNITLPDGWKLTNSIASKLTLIENGMTLEVYANQPEPGRLEISWLLSVDRYDYDPSYNIDLAAFFEKARDVFSTELVLAK